jgi:hypothetical protein
MGPYFDVALDVSKDDTSNHDALDWMNVRGVSDIVSWDAEPLAPNSKPTPKGAPFYIVE